MNIRNDVSEWFQLNKNVGLWARFEWIVGYGFEGTWRSVGLSPACTSSTFTCSPHSFVYGFNVKMFLISKLINGLLVGNSEFEIRPLIGGNFSGPSGTVIGFYILW